MHEDTGKLKRSAECYFNKRILRSSYFMSLNPETVVILVCIAGCCKIRFVRFFKNRRKKWDILIGLKLSRTKAFQTNTQPLSFHL